MYWFRKEWQLLLSYLDLGLRHGYTACLCSHDSGNVKNWRVQCAGRASDGSLLDQQLGVVLPHPLGEIVKAILSQF